MIILALKYFFLSLRTQKKVIWTTIASIGIGIGTLITSISIMNGFQNSILERILHIYGHMDVYSNNLDSKIHLIKNKDWYKRHIHVNEKQGILSSNNETQGVKIIGISKEDCDYIIQDKWVKKSDAKSSAPIIVIGDKLAENFQLSANSNAKLLIPHGVLSNRISIKDLDVKVGSVFRLGFHSFDKNVVFVIGNTLDKYSLGFEQKQYMFYTNNPEKIDDIQKDLYDLSGKSYSIWTWKDTNPSLKQMFSMQNIILAVFIGMFILCCMMQSTNSLWILISERIQDISLLKAFGASNFQIFSLFAYLGLFISLGSILFGLIFGLTLVSLFPKLYNIIHKSYGQTMIHEESFGFSEFIPKVLISDLVIISTISFVIMMLILMNIARQSNKVDIIKGIS
ncbi:ABC transporter permease [Candidatus Cytomitobacter indipagum]|uniref:ABC transporter permease n=1 Tax=Candidatus Cytomitobacter indipagum TaxID=2601575 RepID=A0A5C0UDZ8_9PROT|nr:FtsX-like permease family protein [Candidatus Cytomitobacter indipagum]QEK37873.1 ABC transporter permease [Candidatus Cytomitobacter indipagum]